MSRTLIASFAVVATLGAAVAFRTADAEEPKPSAPVVDPAAALEGGTPIPDGALSIRFDWMPKQSISFVSDASIMRMVGAVSFADPGTKPLGTVTLDGKGGGAGSFRVTLADCTTLSSERDDHMRAETWLDAKKFPEITYTLTKLERVKPTVFRVTGLWKMHGVEKELSTYANVRFFEKMEPIVAKDGIARLKAKLSLSLKAFGVDSPYVGSPAVAETWDVEMVLLGAITKS